MSEPVDMGAMSVTERHDYWRELAGQYNRVIIAREAQIADLQSRLEASQLELEKVAFFTETHWKGAGLPLESKWIIDRWKSHTSECDGEIDRLEAQHAQGLAEYQKLESRLDAIRKAVEPTSAYLSTGHVNALAEIRAILGSGVERRVPEQWLPSASDQETE